MKSLRILIICFCIILMLSHNVFALGNIFDSGKNWLDTGNTVALQGQTMDTEKLKEMSDQLYYLLLGVATGVAVIVGAILGIQYMTAGIDKKVDVKESLFPYMISCVVVFGSLGIWRLVVTLIKLI